jgi:hypothetical protein
MFLRSNLEPLIQAPSSNALPEREPIVLQKQFRWRNRTNRQSLRSTIQLSIRGWPNCRAPKASCCTAWFSVGMVGRVSTKGIMDGLHIAEGERHCLLNSGVRMVAGGGFEPPTFGLCDLTHLSVRVGLYLHPHGVPAIQSLRLPPNFEGLVRYCPIACAT